MNASCFIHSKFTSSKLSQGLLAASLFAALTPTFAGPKGEITVRTLGDARITIDGNIADWPLDKFKTVAEQPLFPEGQNSASTTAKGDHLVFAKNRVGLFNGTTDEAFSANDSDFGVTVYFAHNHQYLYILSVFIDDNLRDDKDTSEFGTSGFLNDGFEFFLDSLGNSADQPDCIADDAFPAVDEGEPNTDDFQVTVAINATFKPDGSAADVLGARQSVERAGNFALIGDTKGGPGGIFRDQLDAIGGPDIAARRYDDLRAAGARNPEILAKPNVKFTGYTIEMRIPLRGLIPNMVSNHSMGFELFWRDVDADDDIGAGGGAISWASWGQSTTVDCGDPTTSLFNTANWGALVFDETDPLIPVPASKPSVLFVASDRYTTPNADADLITFLQDAGYAIDIFSSGGSTPEGLREAAAGKKMVFISETIGSTSVVDPPGQGTGIFSLQDTDIPILSFEAYMYDNADWVTRTEDGSNDFTQWGNTSRSEVAETSINDGRDSLYVRKADHPIVKGLTGKVKVYNELYSLCYGLPSPDADIVASAEADGSYPVIFVYEKGDKLSDGSVAPNKRIGFYLGQNAAPDFNTALDFNNLTADGKTLILNAVAWATGTTPGGGGTPTLTMARNGSNLLLTYSGGTLQSASAITGPWTNESGASPLTVPTTGPGKFYRVRGN